MTEIKSGECWKGVLEGEWGPLNVQFHFPIWAEGKRCRIYGPPFGCGHIQAFAAGTYYDRKYLEEKGLPIPNTPTTFDIRLIAGFVGLYPNHQELKPETPSVVRFHGVAFIDSGCTISGDNVCGGFVEFTCERHEVVALEETADVPMLVGGK